MEKIETEKPVSVTGEQVRDAVLSAGIRMIPYRECSICRVPIYYFVEDNQLYFNSGCGCCHSTPTPRSWDEAAEWINMQTSVHHQHKLMRKFGMDVPNQVHATLNPNHEDP